ncbi:MAG: hypothetical protein HC904_11920 [Blastochloris sp.]|nr:hypothetical protein [Blastochloris sp.]
MFRSLTGLGANRANGIPFKGIETYRDDREGRSLGRNTVYYVEMDGVRFCHLGSLGHALNRKQTEAIGQVDVLFLPVGPKDLAVHELWKIAENLRAKWIVPVTYRTQKNPNPELRGLDEMELEKRTVRRLEGSEFTFSAETLPSLPAVLILQNP